MSSSLITQKYLLFLLSLYATMFNQIISRNEKPVLGCNQKDQEALLKFKDSLMDRYNNLSTWSIKKDCCEWKGITCNSKGRVQKLIMGISYLSGELNLLSLLQLEFLTNLDLYGNDFKEINVQLDQNITHATASSSYSSLQYLDLSYNQFKGPIPNVLLQQNNLTHLDLSNNKFNGSISEWIGQNQNLQHLDISNNLFYGSILSSLENLSSLESLSIGSNFFSETITGTFFSKFVYLDSLDLSNSVFKFNLNSEWIPPFQLSDLILRNTNLGPHFPPWIYTQKSLQSLDVSSAGISFVDRAKFQTLIASPSNCYELSISNNSINVDLSNLTIHCSFLNLDHNNFTGGLPHVSQNVLGMDLSHNSFTGPIPLDWMNTDILFINLWSNRLSGEIQSNISNMTNLWYMNLGKNQLSGIIPSDLPQQLKIMILRFNQFEGSIPQQLFNLSSLFHLDLAHNKLSGTMPISIYNLTEMIAYDGGLVNSSLEFDTIDLFTKGLYYEFRTNVFMVTIDLSANNLSGEIPLDLFQLSQIQTLNLSYNQFTGTIPKAIGGMTKLESLDLSNNKFYGEIPQSMTLLTFLEYLNLSYNNFMGQIPTGTQLQSFDSLSYSGNAQLCGSPLPKCGTNDQVVPKHENEDAEDGEVERKSLYLGMGVGFAMGFWSICGSFVVNKKWRNTYYRFLDQVADKIYVTLMVKFNRFLAKFEVKCNK